MRGGPHPSIAIVHDRLQSNTSGAPTMRTPLSALFALLGALGAMSLSTTYGSTNTNPIVKPGDAAVRQPLLPTVTQPISWLGCAGACFDNTPDAVMFLTNRMKFGWIRDAFQGPGNFTNSD